MTIDISEFATKEDKLLQLSDALESIKSILEEIIDEMDSDGEDTDGLEEASEAVDDAIDAKTVPDTRKIILILKGKVYFFFTVSGTTVCTPQRKKP